MQVCSELVGFLVALNLELLQLWAKMVAPALIA